MMNGREKSDSVVVAMNPTNKAGQPAAEPGERRAGTEGNAGQQSTCRAQNRESVSQALDRVRTAARHRKKERFTTLLKLSYLWNYLRLKINCWIFYSANCLQIQLM